MHTCQWSEYFLYYQTVQDLCLGNAATHGGHVFLSQWDKMISHTYAQSPFFQVSFVKLMVCKPSLELVLDKSFVRFSSFLRMLYTIKYDLIQIHSPYYPQHFPLPMSCISVCFSLFWDKVSLCSPVWSGTQKPTCVCIPRRVIGLRACAVLLFLLNFNFIFW